MKKLRNEIKIFILVVLSRFPDLGYDIFNTDVWKWKARSYDFGSGVFYLDFAKTIQKYHPGVILMWIGTFGIKVYNFYYNYFHGIDPPDNNLQTIFELHFVQKLFLVVVISIVLMAIYSVLERLFSSSYAFLAILFISIEPFYLALTRVFHLEGLMSTFMLASFVFLFFYIQDITNKSHLRISAIFAGLAFLTKTSALFLMPFCGLMLFLYYYRNGKSFFESVKLLLPSFLQWFVITLVVFILLWPAMWIAPFEALKTVYRGIFTIGMERGHEQLYFGKLVLNPGITFYPVALFYRSSYYLLVGLLGYLLLARKKYSSRVKDFVFYAFLFSFLYLVEITIPSKKLDRYILPALMGFSLISTFFYSWLLIFFADNKFIKKVLFLGLLLLPMIMYLVKIHPDYFSYYNFLGGGLKKGVNVIEPKWIIGHHEIVEYLEELKQQRNIGDFLVGESFANSQNLQNRLTVAFPEKYYTQIWPFVRRVGGWAVIEWLTPEAINTKFFVYPVWDDFAYREERFRLEKIDEIYVQNVHLYNVYERF